VKDWVIRVEGLGKQYQIGARKAHHNTLRERLTAAFTGPFRRFMTSVNWSDKNARLETIWALQDVLFEVNEGEVLGVIGHNGAGKSTLLKILSRITEPTDGYAEMRGRVGSLLEVGTGFHSELTGHENIYLNGAILGMKKEEINRKFEEIVAFAEVDKFIDTPVKHYSSGMYMRLAFSVAAHLETEILLVDEVLAVGDAAFQRKCLGKMGEVARAGRTVLFVSHNMGAISVLCNRTILLANGRIQVDGPTSKIVTQYLSGLVSSQHECLDRMRLTGQGEKVRFSDIRLVSEDGVNIRFGEPITYELTVFSAVAQQGLSIGSSIFNGSGVCVGTFFTREEFTVVPHQRLVFTLTVSNVQLAPGSYYAGFSIGAGGRQSPRQDFDIVIGKPAFQVLPIPMHEETTAYWNPGWGSIVFKDTTLTMIRQIVDPREH